MMTRKIAGILAFVLGFAILLSLGYSASLKDGTAHHIILIVIALVLWVGVITWLNLKSTISSMVRLPIIIVVSAAISLWLRWSGVALTRSLLLTLAAIACLMEFLLVLAISFFRQRSIILRFNAAYEAKNANGSCEDFLKEIEACEKALKNCNGLDITYGGTPFKYMILLHKAALLREMGRKRESIALYQDVCPKIKDPEAQQALLEEIKRIKEEWP